MKGKFVYVDTSVILAELFAEDIRPTGSFWDETLFSSRLLEYETWVRIHSKGLSASHGADANQLLSHITFLELGPLVLTRALDPFPIPLRTLDSLHIASIDFLRTRNVAVALATYDMKMLQAATAMHIPLAEGFGEK